MSLRTDYYNLQSRLTDEQLLIKESTAAWVNKKVKNNIDKHFQEASTPTEILQELPLIGAFGTIYSRKIWWYGCRLYFIWTNDARIRTW